MTAAPALPHASFTLRTALRDAASLLGPVSDEEAQLDAELLLRHACGLTRVSLYQRLADHLLPEEQRSYEELLRRRLSHEPTAYILDHKEFFGLDFEVTPAAIIPRPDTETLVEAVITFARQRPSADSITLADVGTGCGAIAVSLARALPQASLVASDAYRDILALAQRNAERHGVNDRIRFLHGDLLQSLDHSVDVIAANLPYVRTADWRRLPPEIRQREPRLGLDGGSDGLHLIHRLLRQAPAYLNCDGALFAEIGDPQSEPALSLARQSFPDARIEVLPDLAGRNRVLAICT